MTNSKEKVRKLFGPLERLDEPVQWPVGLSNMFEWLAWEPDRILGVTKNSYRKLIIEWSHEETVLDEPFEKKEDHARKKHEAECKKHEQSNRYAKQNKNAIASVREAVRRAKYFSENYLNKEFDIFWSLASDRYLDGFYGQFTELSGSGEWFTHGKNMVFEHSTGIKHMQMDNLAYNPKERILVANELKLGGSKNRDQILKHAKMFDLLRERGFILENARFLLLFIGSEQEDSDWDAAIEKERRYCENKAKLRPLIEPENIVVAKSAEYGTTTWQAVMSFNDEYLKRLDPRTQQVEKKLLTGFNQTLSEKFEIQEESATCA